MIQLVLTTREVKKLIGGLLLLIVIVLIQSCSPKNPFNHSYVSGKVKNQTQASLIEQKKAGQFDLPPDVNPSDGLTEEEAIAVALWNNAQFQADMVALKFAQADLTEAGQMQNPTFRYLSPQGGIVAQVIMYVFIDGLIQRPSRVAAVKRDAQKIADNLVLRTFTLIRDVQTSYADLKLAREKAKLLTVNKDVRGEIASLALSRLRNGDISELEATTAHVDSVSALENFLRQAQDTVIMKNRFNNVLGISNPDAFVYLQSSAPATEQLASKSELLDLAYANHPELQASVAAMEAAGKRLGWERSRVIAFSAVLNGQNFANTSTEKNAWPSAFNIGAQIEIPVFNRNRGRILRAKAEMEQAALQYVAVRQRIAMDISEAYERYAVATKTFELWNASVVPSMESAVKQSTDNYASGDVSFLPVLESTRILLDAKLRKAEVEAELRKTVAQLNFRIGKKIVTN